MSFYDGHSDGMLSDREPEHPAQFKAGASVDDRREIASGIGCATVPPSHNVSLTDYIGGSSTSRRTTIDIASCEKFLVAGKLSDI